MNKICTSLEQSKKLIELGIYIETADMCWADDTPNLPTLLAYPITDYDNWENKIPAWSLSALLEIIPNVEIKSKVQNFDNTSWCVSSHDDEDHNHIWAYNDELIDACVELIEKLHKEELL